jgi:predicted TIM-barrel fold metal-dependent hydrolase
MTTIALFGLERCMFGSNFPVDSLCASFDDIFEGFAAITSGFSPDERARLFHHNAMRIYAIPPAWLH